MKMHSNKTATLLQPLVVMAFALVMAVVCVAVVRPGGVAWADVETDLANAQAAVQESTDAYTKAIQRAEEIDAQIAELSARITELEAKLPAQRAASNEAFIAMYKMQQEGYSLLDAILSSENIGEFLRRLEYITRVQNANRDALLKLIDMQKELNESNATLQEQKVEADAQRAAAEAALAQAKAAHESAQAAAEAQRRADEEALAAAAAAGKSPADMEANVPSDANEGSQASGESPSAMAPPSSDGADWSSDRDSFINHWGGRIDSYLGGSPLSGQGRTFAAAAWDYGVDPRWSPAISCIESSKGAYCFRSHNAWGWGSVSWGSWEEAIYGHVGGLSRGYGYTISVAAAQKYCPPNWAFWYDRVSQEMNRI